MKLSVSYLSCCLNFSTFVGSRTSRIANWILILRNCVTWFGVGGCSVWLLDVLQGIDIRHNKDRKVHRKEPRSNDIYLRLLVKVSIWHFRSSVGWRVLLGIYEGKSLVLEQSLLIQPNTVALVAYKILKLFQYWSLSNTNYQPDLLMEVYIRTYISANNASCYSHLRL